MKCRHCSATVSLPLIDLGTSPPSNSYLTEAALQKPEKWLPLRVLVCEKCWLVQTEDFSAADDLFDENYAYFSGYSKSWLAHSKRYADEMTRRFSLSRSSLVVEVAANDGYLLQYFKESQIPCLGIEPTASTARAARAKGITVVEDFFGIRMADDLVSQGTQADLTAANNVLAHVPDINDFVSGFARLLKPAGVATFEFPHLLNLLLQNQFDTIYHEHFSYLSLTAVAEIFRANGLVVFDVEEHQTHGGSLRVFAQRLDTGVHPVSRAVRDLLAKEEAAGLRTRERYSQLHRSAEKIRADLVAFLEEARAGGHTVVGYGAAAKGNTLLNYARVTSAHVKWVVDQNPAKQGKFLPGSRIPIVGEAHIRRERPSHILILPWNLRDEIMEQLAYVRDWGGKFVWAIPQLAVT
jgi:SAM-dependent methyltransferase